MSYQRVENVFNHAPATITGTARMILAVIASRIPGTDGDRTAAISREDLARSAAVKPKHVPNILGKLAADGWDVRVALAKDKSGNPVYAFNGSYAKYRLPWFEAPTGCDCPDCRKGSVSADPSSLEPAVKGQRGLTHSPREGSASADPSSRKGQRSRQKGSALADPVPITKQTTELLGARTTTDEWPPKEPGAEATVTATATPQSPSANRPVQTTPQPAEPLRIIADALADENPTPDEIAAINRQWITAAKPRSTRLYTVVAEQGGIAWRTTLAEIRQQARVHLAAEVGRLRQGPACPHGEPGGENIHPTSRRPLCPHCRNGIPADRGPDPVETYRTIYRATHNRSPDRQRMAAVAAQADHMRKRGADTLTIAAHATAAAVADHDLVEHLHAKDKISA